MIGKRLAHYKILQRLGAGGMGEVYLADDTKLDRKVAIKFLPPESTADEHAKKRLVREAKAAAKLDHPNICSIHEVGEADGHSFIVMQHVEGETLDSRIHRKPLDPGECLDIAVQVADALLEAHRRGIIHRDIKPANIMLTPRGHVKVLDFGLAKVVRASVAAESEAETASLLTATGTIVGTPAYMSPEQVKGEELDARSDIFSFGTLLYELLSGQRPFEAKSTAEVVAAILTQEPPLLRRQTGVAPESLGRLLRKCLEKEAGRRYQGMEQLTVDLEQVRRECESGRGVVSLSDAATTSLRADIRTAPEDLHEESRARLQLAVPSLRRWTWVILPALLVVTALFGLFAWQPWSPAPPTEPLRAAALTTLPGVEQSPSLSPDGNHVVFAWADPKQGNQNIYVQQIGSGSPVQRTTDSLDDYNAVWSPDGKWIAFLRSQPPAPTGLRRRELWIMPPLGGSERKLAEVQGQDFFPVPAYLAWSADSSSLIVTDSSANGQPDALFAVSLETRDKRQLTDPQPPVQADTSPAVSPDGSSLVFLRRTTWGSGELHLLPLGKGLTAAGEPRRLTLAELYADYPAWMPDGKEIIFSAKGSLWRLAVTGENAPTRIPYVGEDGLTPAISRAQPGMPARLVYVRSFWDANFWRIETPAAGAPSSSLPVVAISSTKEEYHCQFSPDGRKVAFASWRSGDAEIWISDPDGSNAVPLTSMRAQDTNCPHWSPDGQLIAFSSNGEGEWDIYVVPATGGKPHRLTDHPAIDINPIFSRDGKWIYFNSTRNAKPGDYRIWKVPATGGEAIQVTANHGAQAFEAADGSHIYYSEASIPSRVWRLPTSGGEPVKVLDGIIWFNFCLVEKGIYYIDRLGSEHRLQYLSFATSKSTTVARNLGDIRAGLTATPDGRTILYTRIDSSVEDLMLVENFR